MKRNKIGVVGGGFAGLTLTWELIKRGWEVTLFEKEKEFGGLARGFRVKGWRWPLDRFYRHVFATDKEFRLLLKELGVAKKLFFHRPLSAVWWRGRAFPFTSAGDILSFSPLSFGSRLWLGGGTALLKFLPCFSFYEKIAASKILPYLMGKAGYQLVWEPLLQQKFGRFLPRLPLSWFGARLKARTASLGYYQGSFSKLANLMVRKIKEAGGKTKRNFKIEKISRTHQRFLVVGKGKSYSFDKLILTTPLPVSLRLAAEILPQERKQFGKRKTLGVAVLVLRLKEGFLPNQIYWLSILEKKWPFVAVVEQTNFVNRQYYNYETVVYLGGYYPSSHPIFKMQEKEVLAYFLPYARKINPRVKKNLLASYLFTNLYAQPVPQLGQKPLFFQTSCPGLWWLNMHHVYPWDRGVNFAVKYARLLVEKM